jgi:hypothetical protein
MFSLNPVAIAKAEILKVDADLPNEIAELEHGLTVFGQFMSYVTPADVEAVLALLPAPLAAKIPAEVMTEVSTVLANLPATLAKVEAKLESIKTELA